MTQREESKLLKGLGIGACMGATLASACIPIMQNVAYGQELDSGNQSASSEQPTSRSSVSENPVTIVPSTSAINEQPADSNVANSNEEPSDQGNGGAAVTPQPTNPPANSSTGGSDSDINNGSNSSTDNSGSSSSTPAPTDPSTSNSSSSNSAGSSSSSTGGSSSSSSSGTNSVVKSAPAPSKPSNSIPPANNPNVSNNNVSNNTGAASQAGTDNGAKGSASSSSEGDYRFAKNQTTQEFISKIGEDARQVAGSNDLYASVMIAQAILESASGNSTLAREPNHNLFGIKGSFEGKSVTMSTQEDNGSGSMYTIQSAFRKYPSYKESLGDYAKLLKGGTDYLSSFYAGTWKSRTESYKDATAYLTGRYATDTAYNKKLNALIETYNLTQYDEPSTNASTTDGVATIATTTVVQQPDVIHIVEAGDTLWGISEKYGVSISDLMGNNHLESTVIYVGEQLLIKKGEQVVQVVETTAQASPLADKEKRLDMSEKASEVIYTIGQGISAALDDKVDTKSSLNYKVSGKVALGNNYRIVSEGDTLKTLAAKYNVPVEKLAEWNEAEDKILTVGQKLIVSLPYLINS